MLDVGRWTLDVGRVWCQGCDVLRWKTESSYKVATTEAVQNRNALLAIGKDLSIVDLLLDDGVLVVEVEPRDATINLRHHLPCLVMPPL